MFSGMELDLQADLLRRSRGEKPESASVGTQGTMGMAAAYGCTKAVAWGWS